MQICHPEVKIADDGLFFQPNTATLSEWMVYFYLSEITCLVAATMLIEGNQMLIRCILNLESGAHIVAMQNYF